ncbi:MAG: diguanylate cyclase [Paenibacillaceae bacterium]|nr:diguanylate cyclase [Paenibacillaceae bacterium]
MDMSHLQALLYSKIKLKMADWSTCNYIPESEMYAFLHMIIGTAGTVGLTGIGGLARDKLRDLTEGSDKQWSKAEWQEFMDPFQELVNAVEKAANMAAHPAPVAAAAAPAPAPALEQEPRPPSHFILLIDDDRDFVASLKDTLEKEGYSVSIALTLQKGLELYYQLKPDWVAISIHLQDDDTQEISRQIISKARKENTAVALTGNEDTKEHRLYTYSLGALDFLTKPMDPEVFRAYLNNRFMYKKEIESAIIVDELTGAFNRKHFNTMMQFFISAYQREETPFCLVMMDLDHFKQVNDRYGHPKGDEVLQTFARIARENKRETDLLFRYGGEEFAFILPRTTDETAEKLIQRFRKALVEHVFESAQGNFRMTFSAGLIQPTSKKVLAEEIVAKADQALYSAKQNGRNRTVVWRNEALTERQPARLQIIIIDDVLIVREVLMRQFENWVPLNKAEVIASEYADGVSFLQSNWYNPNDLYVILLDGIMPRMDGIEVLRQIRSTYAHHNIIVTMLTARREEFDVINAIEHGADDYIVKPFEAEEVPSRIQRLISRRFG